MIRNHMMTKISTNGTSDIRMSVVPPAPAAWAKAGVITKRLLHRSGAKATGRVARQNASSNQ
jgi:hypothetical protein